MNHNHVMHVDIRYEFHGKAKLPKGFSFPMKRSVLDNFLRREGITKVTGVSFCGNSGDNIVLTARYYGPRRKSSRHTLSLSIYAVPSEIRKLVEELVVNEALPRLAKWLLSFSEESLLRARTDHSMTFTLEGTSGGDRSASSGGSGDFRLVVQSKSEGHLLK
ncbi:hypothetical protein P12x_004512 [Tundrisphaera lichenicola]|uniref:hypothetical protein n=1 Tax=Tundrisphaera lichenicola TaxID=2029860 RepID=UPI003EBDE654